MQQKSPTYQSYLIRLWPSRSFGEAACRILLMDPRSSESRGFASLEEMTRFLQGELCSGEGIDLVTERY